MAEISRVLGYNSAIENHPNTIKVAITDQKKVIYSSREMIELERTMVMEASYLNAKPGHGVNDKFKLQALYGTLLNDSQLKSLNYVLKKGNLKIIVGVAGSGKSRLMETAKLIWEAQGYRVMGAALSGIAAQNLQESGIQSRTIDSLFYAMDNDRLSFTENDILVIDEAGMVDTRKLARLLTAANQGRAKIILVGDAEQLQPIQAGAAFRAIAERIGYAELNEVIRQYAPLSPERTIEMREATKEFATQRTVEALTRYDKLGNIYQHLTREDALEAIVQAWNRDRHMANSQIMLAYLRRDVNTLNEKARAILKAVGAFKDEQILLVKSRDNEEFAKAFSIHERVYFIKNDLELGVKNGSLGTLVSMKGNELTVKLDTGTTITFNLRDYNYIDYGYAATVHKSQGVTIDKAYLLADKYLDRHATYVGSTRHKDLLEIHFDTQTFNDKQHFYQTLSRENLKEMVMDYADVRHFEALLHDAYDINQAIDEPQIKTKQAFKFDHETNAILTVYTKKLAELDELIKLKNIHLAKNPQVAKAYGEQALIVDKELQAIADNALQQPAIKRELELRAKEPLATIAQSGGFQALKLKLEQGELAAQDITALLRHLQARAQEGERSRGREQGRT